MKISRKGLILLGTALSEPPVKLQHISLLLVNEQRQRQKNTSTLLFHISLISRLQVLQLQKSNERDHRLTKKNTTTGKINSYLLNELLYKKMEIYFSQYSCFIM